MSRYLRILPAAALMLCAGWVLAQTGSGGGYATLKLKVPENATVKVGDYLSTQKGTARTLYTPSLVPGYTYYYDVEITWSDGGGSHMVSQRVKFQANKTVDLDANQLAKRQVDTKVAETKKEETKKAEVKKDETKKVDPPKKEEIKKVEPPKKEETKKDDTKKEEAKKEEVKPKKGKKDQTKKEVKKDEPKVDERVFGKARTFMFTYAGEVKDLKPGQEASIWLPVAVSTPEQDIEIATKKLPVNGSFATGKEYGNRSLFFTGKADKDGKIPFEIVYKVIRREVKTDIKSGATLQPRAVEKVSRFLEPDKLVPISGKPMDLIKDKKLPKNDQFMAAKELYEVVNNHMKYSKEGKGWGLGDAVWACDSKFGNCTDFHALFISMARGNKIPSKFEMGFPVPPKRGAGVIGGYHCWAWFMPDGKGWVPVDISEANRFPEMKNYYFGSLTEDRVQFTTGRDINLEPRQKGPALNYFIYPYVEVNGQAYPAEKVGRSFAYQDL